jgi:hypothetical protein
MRKLRVARQRRLLEEKTPAIPIVQLPQEVQERLRQALLQWLRALAKASQKGRGDE